MKNGTKVKMCIQQSEKKKNYLALSGVVNFLFKLNLMNIYGLRLNTLRALSHTNKSIQSR